MQGGDLRKALARDSAGEYSWSNRGRQVAMDITRGLHFLHTSGVVHRRVERIKGRVKQESGKALHRRVEWAR